MSRKGNGWDNAPTESGFNRFKNERVQSVRNATHAEIKATTFEYIEVFYNRKRQYSTLGYKSPVQFLENWISEQHQEKLVAGNPPFGRRKTEGTSDVYCLVATSRRTAMGKRPTDCSSGSAVQKLVAIVSTTRPPASSSSSCKGSLPRAWVAHERQGSKQRIATSM